MKAMRHRRRRLYSVEEMEAQDARLRVWVTMFIGLAFIFCLVLWSARYQIDTLRSENAALSEMVSR